MSANAQQGQLLNWSQLTLALSKFEGNSEPIRTANVHNENGPMHAGDKVKEWQGSSPDTAVGIVIGMSAVQAQIYFGGGAAVQRQGAPPAAAGAAFGVSLSAAQAGYGGSPQPQPSAEEIAATRVEMEKFQGSMMNGFGSMMGAFSQRTGGGNGGMGGGWGDMGGMGNGPSGMGMGNMMPGGGFGGMMGSMPTGFGHDGGNSMFGAGMFASMSRTKPSTPQPHEDGKSDA
ncbi:hypothetical protein C8R43DRAFT_453030 [Mycena crocata]|nr:hypothetical protein C8R43DRAFT_453030 [Mycena crocata]